MLAITFGDEGERARALDAIGAIHRRVHGTLPAACGRFPAGTPYSAEDPALLLWVHATLIDSILVVYARLVAPQSEAERARTVLTARMWLSRLALVPMRSPAAGGSCTRTWTWNMRRRRSR